MDQVVAGVLRREPAKLDLVITWIEQRLADPDYSVHSKDALSEWLDLIRSRGLSAVLEKLADRSEDAFRIRIGDYRVIYTVDDTVCIVAIENVRHRSEAYR